VIRLHCCRSRSIVPQKLNFCKR